MKVGLIMIAATAMSAAAMAVAEPAQPNGQKASSPSNRPAEVILASAERLPGAESPTADVQTPSAPVKRPRAARVTTCRCGDPQQ